MKKSELRSGVAYYVNTTDRVSSYSDSYQRVHEMNRSNRYFVVTHGSGEIATPYSNNSAVKMTNCPTFGLECPTHESTNGYVRCYSKNVRLMDIRGEYYPTIQAAVLNHKQRYADGGRGDRYARHLRNKQQRQQNAIEKPIKQEFYDLICQVTGKVWVSEYHNLGSFTVDQMSALIEALKASQKVGA